MILVYQLRGIGFEIQIIRSLKDGNPKEIAVEDC